MRKDGGQGEEKEVSGVEERTERTLCRYPRAMRLPSTELEGDNPIFETFPV